ncbi:MAG: antibiotic biosynthesis monooxygenase [Actinomycetales bacterium]
MSQTEPPRGPAAGVTMAVARQVHPGREDDFAEWARRMTEAAVEETEGFLGWGLLRPAGQDRIWTIIVRFTDEQELARWDASPRRAALLAEGSEFMSEVATGRVDGLDAWFDPPPELPAPPPRWKTFLMTAVVIVVLQTAVSLLLRPLTGAWAMFPRTALTIVVVVALMTWLVMPGLSRALRGWLYRRRT